MAENRYEPTTQVGARRPGTTRTQEEALADYRRQQADAGPVRPSADTADRPMGRDTVNVVTAPRQATLPTPQTTTQPAVLQAPSNVPTPTPAPAPAPQEEPGEQQPQEGDFWSDLMARHDESWGNIEKTLDARSAMRQRQIMAANAAGGRAWAGGAVGNFVRGAMMGQQALGGARAQHEESRQQLAMQQLADRRRVEDREWERERYDTESLATTDDTRLGQLAHSEGPGSTADAEARRRAGMTEQEWNAGGRDEWMRTAEKTAARDLWNQSLGDLTNKAWTWGNIGGHAPHVTQGLINEFTDRLRDAYNGPNPEQAIKRIVSEFEGRFSVGGE